MTLDELVMAQDDETVIFIGANSSYFFIGTKEDYINDISTVNEYYLNTGKRYERKQKRLLYLYQNEGIKIPYIENASYEKCLRSGIERRYKELKNQFSKTQSAIAYVRDYVPLNERNVISSDEKKLTEKGLQIIVDGTENGKYWFRYEYQLDLGEEDENNDN